MNDFTSTQGKFMNNHDRHIVNQQLNQVNNLLDLVSERLVIAGNTKKAEKLKALQSQLTDLEMLAHAA